MKVSQSNERVRITDFSPFALLVSLAVICFMVAMFFQLSDDWLLPDSFIKKSSRDLVELSPYQDTVLFFAAMSVLAYAFAWVGTYTRVVFDLSSGQVHWKRISVLGRRSLTFPLTSVTNLFVESGQALGTRARDRYDCKVMLCVDGQFLDLSKGESRVDARGLERYRELVQEARAAIWSDGKPPVSAEGSLINADDPQLLREKSGLSEISPGVYALTRFHFVVPVAVATLLFLLYQLLINVPGYWGTFQEGVGQWHVLQMILSFLALTIVPVCLIGVMLLFAMIGLWDRIVFDTQQREVRTWHLGFFSWSRQRFDFDEIVEVRLQEHEDDADARFGVLGSYTQVVLVTREAECIPVNDSSYGVEHRVSCCWLAAALNSLLEVDERAETPRGDVLPPPRRRLVKRPVLTTFSVLLALFAGMLTVALLTHDAADSPQVAAGEQKRGLPPLDAETLAHPPEISVASATYDFGTVNLFSAIHPKFELTNRGAGPLKIGKITASRNEIYPQVGKKVLQPGESTVLEFEYNLGSHRGRHEYTLNVQTNDPQQRELQLQVTGEAVPLIATDPEPLVIPKTAGEAAVGTVLVTTRKDAAFHIVGSETSGKHVTLKIEPVEEGREYKVIVTVQKDADIQQGKRSRFSEWVHLQTDDKGKYGRLAFAVKGEFAR
ncbi:DUF1573 domain-containing protein [Gimesia panareensis]|uniref:DUF1573 domain-containing protein n=1 Tax=Gimesia panareensis TaxID=2527978 RepID=UPI00118CB19E|nr:DUF1573 domain-containing protein [Gimesia panareensis]QDU47718.1 hypothetical protein Pan110_00280 [Gimesia panareensis]